MTYIVFFVIIVAITLISVATIAMIKENLGVMDFYLIMIFGALVLAMAVPQVFVIDRDPDMTIGVLVGMEENPFGTYTLYIRNNDSDQKHYCMEDPDIIAFAKTLIGETVRVGWGERVGIYPLEKCNQAPIIHIERWEDLWNMKKELKSIE